VIIDGNGDVIHEAGSWANLSNQTMATLKNKGKEQAVEHVQDEQDELWAPEPKPGHTPANQPELVCTTWIGI
jgi:hypothetical protein